MRTSCAPGRKNRLRSFIWKTKALLKTTRRTLVTICIYPGKSEMLASTITATGSNGMAGTVLFCFCEENTKCTVCRVLNKQERAPVPLPFLLSKHTHTHREIINFLKDEEEGREEEELRSELTHESN